MNDSYRLSSLQRTRTRLPWITFLFLAVVFFVAQHDLFISLIEGFLRSEDFIEKATIEGSLKRRIAFLSLGLFGIVSLMRQGRSRLKINGLLGWLILFYLVWAFSSLVWAEDIALTFRRLVLFAMLCLGAVAVAGRFSLRNIVLWVFFSAALYLFIGIIAEIALGTFRPFAPGYRFAGTIHPNIQGINCYLLMLSCITAAQFEKRGSKLFLAFVLIGFVFLILTKSRTSLASALLALFAFWVLVSSISRNLVFILGVSLTFCLILLLVGNAFFPALRQGVLLGREDPTTYTLTGRIPLWNECLEYVSKRPFIGYGYNSFWTPHHIREISDDQEWGVSAGHSVYLELLLNVGIIGMITFVLIFILGIKKSVKYLKVSRNIVYAFLCALLVFCLFDGILESAIINPSFLMFLSMVVLARLGFQDPHRY